MALQRFGFTKVWTSSTDFPTYQANEQQARSDMQELHNQTRDYINNTLLASIEAQLATERAWVQNAVEEATVGTLPDDSITRAKIKSTEGMVLPAVTSADNGKMLRVVSGGWALVAVADGEETEY